MTEQTFGGIKMGDKVRDTITGFEGTVTARVEYINGCNQLGIVPQCTDPAKAPEISYYDWQRLEVVGAIPAPASSPTGGPQRDAPSRFGPTE